MKKVLVMGGSYFIGKKTVNLLAAANYDVTVLNRGSRKIQNEKVHQLICDRNNAEQMNKLLHKAHFDIIIDVCGLNKNQARILCEAIDVTGLSHFFFISSSAVYSVDSLSIPFTENDSLGPNVWGDYGTDKIEAERYLSAFFESAGVRLTILRPPYVYGENNYAQRESFIFDHLSSGRPVLIPDTNPQLQFIYTTDLANIIMRLLNTRSGPGIDIFNVGNESAVTAREWVMACGNAAGTAPCIIEYDYRKDHLSIRDFFPFHDYDNVLDVSKIKAVYPYETPFLSGLKEAYKWYLAEKDSLRFKETVAQNEEQILKKLQITT